MLALGELADAPARQYVRLMERSARLLTALSLLMACSGDDKVTDTAADTGTTTATATDTGSGTDTETTGQPVPFEPIPARGITIKRIQANQGVGVDIARDGVGLGGADRGSYLIQNRVTLLRGFWEIGDGWQPRPIEARLLITYQDGTTAEQRQTLTIDGEAFEGDLKRTFYFGLMADEVRPGMNFEMSLWETQPGQEDTPESDPPPRLPYVGNYPIGIENSDQLLEVVIVPFSYNDGDKCNTAAENSDETLAMFETYMFAQNPVDATKITFHAPIAWDKKLSDFNELNSFMSGLRFDEGAGPNVYYYGLINPCSGGVGGAGGKAYGIPSLPATKGQAYQRVSSGIWLPNNKEWSAETFVHEVGHSQGRYHIDCGGAAGFDPSYPYPEGQVGEWGFSVRDFGLRHPTVHKDYMTYCNPTWVGTFGWNKTYPVIKETTKWTREAAPAPGEDPYGGSSLAVGNLYPDGTITWITVPGDLRDEELSSTDLVEFVADGQLLSATPAAVQRQPEGEILNIVARLPDGFEGVTELRHRTADALRVTPIHEVKLHHRSRAVTLTAK